MTLSLVQRQGCDCCSSAPGTATDLFLLYCVAAGISSVLASGCTRLCFGTLARRRGVGKRYGSRSEPLSFRELEKPPREMYVRLSECMYQSDLCCDCRCCLKGDGHGDFSQRAESVRVMPRVRIDLVFGSWECFKPKPWTTDPNPDSTLHARLPSRQGYAYSTVMISDSGNRCHRHTDR